MSWIASGAIVVAGCDTYAALREYRYLRMLTPVIYYCEYCGSKVPSDRCDSCGAPKRKPKTPKPKDNEPNRPHHRPQSDLD